MQKIVGINMEDSLFIEYPKNTSNHFRSVDAIAAMKDRIAEISLRQPEKALEILETGKSLNSRVSNLIDEKRSIAPDEALSLLIDLAIHATIFPMFAVEKLNEQDPDHAKTSALCTALRSKSYYPQFLSEVFIPSIKETLESQGVSGDDYPFLTIHEILSGEFDHLARRKAFAKSGMYYVYRCGGGNETVYYVTHPEEIISKIEKSALQDISGQPVYEGIVSGVVRKLLSDDPSAQFEQGEILVAISTNPNIIPLMKKASAIITDEGGIMCHAAIISRELKIPCIVGTKNATRVLKDGDKIKIDANKGTVEILSDDFV